MYPFVAVRVVFPDGSEFLDVPVANVDPMAGFAVLGPIDAAAPPLELVDGEDMAIGAELFLIVYPQEDEPYPQSVIGQGSLQSVWEPEHAGITHFQTDITVSEGLLFTISEGLIHQDTVSGGALVNRQGEMVGISTPVPSFERTDLTMAASASDLAPIIERLIHGETHPLLVHGDLPPSGQSTEYVFSTREDWDSHWEGWNSPSTSFSAHRRTFLVMEPVGTVVDVELFGDAYHLQYTLGPARIWSPGLDQEVISHSVHWPQHESGSVKLTSDVPHFLTIEFTPRFDDGGPVLGDVTLRSNVRLIPLRDPDMGREIAVGDTIVGNVAAVDNVTGGGSEPSGSGLVSLVEDWYKIRLTEGETVAISSESVASIRHDMTMVVDFPGSRENQVVRRQWEGGGARLANDFKIVYRAPHTGDYFIDVRAGAGYYLTVEEAPAGLEPVLVPPSPMVEGEISSPFGPMTVYRSVLGGFSIQVPAGWKYSEDQQRHDPFAEIQRAYGPNGEELIIGFDNEDIAGIKEGLAERGASVAELEATPEWDWLDTAGFLFLFWLGPYPHSTPDEPEEYLGVSQTAQGIPMARWLRYSGSVAAVYYLAEAEAWVGVAYSFPADDDEMRALADYSFCTFRVD